MQLKNSQVIVVGGSRGLGLATVEALVAEQAMVTVVARDAGHLETIAARLPIKTRAADVTDPDAASMILEQVVPDAVVFVAGAPPHMAPIATIAWEAFSTNWMVDVRGALNWIQAALARPLAPGARFLTVSSGAAVNGSPLSGGYGGAKRMQWLMTNYADSYAQQAGLGIGFQTFVPSQMIAGTGTGDAGSRAYAARLGISQEEFLARFGKALSPADVARAIVRVLSEDAFDRARALRITGDEGLTVLEAAVA